MNATEWKQAIRNQLADLNLDPAREMEIVEELSQHMEDRYRELLSIGASKDEAHRAAMAELNQNKLLTGELRRVERAVKYEPVALGAGRTNMLADIGRDFRFGARMIKKNAGLAGLVVFALALGICINTTIFSSVDAMVLHPFSFSNEARLVVLFERKLSIGITRASISPGNVIEWRAQSQTLQEIVAMHNREYIMTCDGSPERCTSYAVSASFFDTLGVEPQLGRGFQPGEDQEGREQVAVLRHAFWQTRFGGDPEIVGKQILLDGKQFTVIGVMPEHFDFPYDGGEMWTPLVFGPQMTREHSAHYMRVLGLLKPGVTVEQVNADLDRISKRIEQQYPDGEAGHTAVAVSLNEWYTRGVRVALPAIIGSAIFMLLIACSNVANLLLVRASTRRKEIALRLAMGASRWRLIRQLLTESVMLAIAGGTLGVMMASWSLKAIVLGIPPGMSRYIPGWSQAGLNHRVLAFTALISVLTGVLFGLLPALRATGTDLNQTLKEGSTRTVKGGSNRMRNALVVVELALSLVLLIGAGLMVRSVIWILQTDLGVKPDGVVTMNLVWPREKYAQAQQRLNICEQLLERIAALPGVINVGAVHALPMSGKIDGNSFQIVGLPEFEPGKEPHTDFRIATPGYFAAIGTEVQRGRSLNEQDTAKAKRVLLVNDAFAARFLKGTEPVGQRITMASDSDKPLEIIGVVANVMNADLDDLAEPCVYLPFAQNPVSYMTLVIRATGASVEIVPAVRRELAEIDAGLPLSEARLMTDVIYERRSPKEVMMWMLVVLGLLALALAAVGTYAVMAYAVAERTQEFGVRIALGAQTADILKVVMGRGLKLTLIGVGTGLAGAFTLTRALARLLYGITPTDMLTFAGVSLGLAMVALLACYIPARRALRVDPMAVLRCE